MELQTKLRFLSLYKMVLADGIVLPDEMVKLHTIGKDRYGLTNEAINQLILEDLTELPTPSSEEDKIRLLYQMSQIAWSDNELAPSERELLVTYALHFGINESAVDSVIDFLLQCAESNMDESDVLSNFN